MSKVKSHDSNARTGVLNNLIKFIHVFLRGLSKSICFFPLSAFHQKVPFADINFILVIFSNILKWLQHVVNELWNYYFWHFAPL